MNSREFAKKWLEQHGMFDADSDYGGMVGESVMEVWNLIAEQGHSGFSAAMLFSCIESIHKDYSNSDSPIWQEFWASPEGQVILESAGIPADVRPTFMKPK